MNTLPIIEAAKDELIEIFKDLHQHPEIGFTEYRTAGVVSEKLKEYGVDEIHTGIAGTGVVGIIKGKEGSRRVGLRADMDALPIDELTNLNYSSKTPGVMHACGHDGHTTMLLGAAKHLAETRDFIGIAVLIFQPAEEGLGGARGMLADGLFERFPCDEIYGMHNTPNGRPGTVGICKGPAMAGASFFDITIQGKGSHAAMPHQSRDPLVIASDLVGSIQTVLSRNVAPLETCVLSVTQIHSGTAYNVIPSECNIAGTMRYFDSELANLVRDRMRKIIDGIAKSYDVEIELDNKEIFDVLVNDESLTNAMLDVAVDIVGEDNASLRKDLVTGSEDFSDMLKVIPGAYCNIGHGGKLPLHNDGFILDDNILPIGASIYARLVEKRGYEGL